VHASVLSQERPAVEVIPVGEIAAPHGPLSRTRLQQDSWVPHILGAADRRSAARSGRAIGRLVELPVGTMHVREDGPPDGPMVVLLHGYASSLHAFDRVTPILATADRVVRVDLLGHGSSPLEAPDYGAEAQAAMIARVLDQLGVTPETVVGHSFGADVAIALAEQTGRVTRVVVIGQAPDYADARLPRGNQLLSHPRAGRWLRRLAPAAAIDRASRFAFAPGAHAAELFDQPDRRSVDFRATAPAMHRTVLLDRPHALAMRGLDARLADLALPTLVILGAQDQLYPVARTQARYARVPGVRVEVLAGSGHSPPLEQPEATARLIAGFSAAAS
jgi:pimeloyl-ACP methyl ester carboxylesterase